MAIVTVSQMTWNKLLPKVAPIAPKKKRYSFKKRRAMKVYRFRTKGRAFQNRQGPGRKTKRVKNTTITHL